MKIETAKVTSFVERFETMAENEKADKKTWREQAEAAGLNVKALRGIMRERKRKADPEADAAMDAYRLALGMACEMVSNGDVSLRQAEKITGVSKSSIQRALTVPEVSQKPEPSAATWQAVTSAREAFEAAREAERLAKIEERRIAREALAAKNRAIDADPLTIPSFLKATKQDAEASVSSERSEAVHA